MHEQVKGFLSKCTALRVDLLQDHQIYCFQACMCALFSPEIVQAGAVKGVNLPSVSFNERLLNILHNFAFTECMCIVTDCIFNHLSYTVCCNRGSFFLLFFFFHPCVAYCVKMEEILHLWITECVGIQDSHPCVTKCVGT